MHPKALSAICREGLIRIMEGATAGSGG